MRKRAKDRTPADAILLLYKRRGTYRALARELGESPGALNSIAQGKRSVPNRIIIKLNRALNWRLPLHPVPAAPCVKCGEVHVKRSCPKRRKPRPARDLFDLPLDTLRALLRARKEYTP